MLDPLSSICLRPPIVLCNNAAGPELSSRHLHGETISLCQGPHALDCPLPCRM